MEHNPVKQRIVGAIILLSVVVIVLPMFFGGGGRENREEAAIPPKPPQRTETAIIPLQVQEVAREAGDEQRPLIVEQAAPEEPAPAATPAQTAEAPPAAEATAPPASVPAPAPAAVPAPAPAPAQAEVPPPPAAPLPAPPAREAVSARQEVKPPVKPEAKPERPAPAAGAWVVQVGSFSSDVNALALRDRLRAKKIPAFVEKVAGGGAPVFRVRVGPEAERARADALRQRLLDEFQLQGMVMPHR